MRLPSHISSTVDRRRASLRFTPHHVFTLDFGTMLIVSG